VRMGVQQHVAYATGLSTDRSIRPTHLASSRTIMHEAMRPRPIRIIVSPEHSLDCIRRDDRACGDELAMLTMFCLRLSSARVSQSADPSIFDVMSAAAAAASAAKPATTAGASASSSSDAAGGTFADTIYQYDEEAINKIRKERPWENKSADTRHADTWSV
jgi:hypothetical protein